MPDLPKSSRLVVYAITSVEAITMSWKKRRRLADAQAQAPHSSGASRSSAPCACSWCAVGAARTDRRPCHAGPHVSSARGVGRRASPLRRPTAEPAASAFIYADCSGAPEQFHATSMLIRHQLLRELESGTYVGAHPRRLRLHLLRLAVAAAAERRWPSLRTTARRRPEFPQPLLHFANAASVRTHFFLAPQAAFNSL